MRSKQLLLVAVFLGFLFLLIGNVFALSCNVKSTPDSANGVIMALSDTTNAHGEDSRSGESNYDYSISCDFEGTDSCIGKNNVLRLSDTTNAHAELWDYDGSYGTDICFGGLECRNTTKDSCLADEMEIVSLYDTTNAHLGGFDDYSQKICCKWDYNLYWAWEKTGEPVSEVKVGSEVKLVLNNSGVDYDLNFIIKTDNLFLDNDILPRDRTGAIIGESKDKGDFLNSEGSWFITQDDYDEAGDTDQFYFILNSVSGKDEGVYLKVLPGSTGVWCSDFNGDEVNCNAEPYNSPAANRSVTKKQRTFDGVIYECSESLGGNYELGCKCTWDDLTSGCAGATEAISVVDTTVAPHCANGVMDKGIEDGIDCNSLETVGGECGACVLIDGVMQVATHCTNNTMDWDEAGLDCGGFDCGICSYAISFPKIGSCSYVSQGEDDCEDGFLEYAWTGNWAWSHEVFSDRNNEFSNVESDYVGVDGAWHYDPLKMSENCIGGINTIACPAQIQLPFFGFFGIVASLILISVIYGFLIFNKKK